MTTNGPEKPDVCAEFYPAVTSLTEHTADSSFPVVIENEYDQLKPDKLAKWRHTSSQFAGRSIEASPVLRRHILNAFLFYYTTSLNDGSDQPLREYTTSLPQRLLTLTADPIKSSHA
ncbi:hypothetical protein PSTG_07319 [Puccinia striiformis f. sp. tritici PST-78]|uniref:Uncharacterized protein n=1 Tax=Puccinia striiformis f. sp. tritici PST-78 TaxID=1165861 RepID=A0A0L0VK73_9BASI|nr:hypothetical protein PSTG_07319 [Puccinia striiformis f. sp. tritici PST-78]